MDRYRIKPDSKVKLADFDPNETSSWDKKKEAALAELEKLKGELDNLQTVLFAEGKHRVLVVIQAMDTAGKDGTIHSVFSGINPQGVRVVGFKAPTSTELARDYLWRIHAQVPARGELVVFNRSHYEDVLVVRVHNLVPQTVWEKRYRHMIEFERMLTDEGVTIVKFFLHIDLKVQKERLIDRIVTPEKQWKFNPDDLSERKLWLDYMKAFEEVFEKTSTDWAPWYVIPSNRNWYRNLLVAQILVKVLKDLHMEYPKPKEDLSKYKVELEQEK